MASELVYTLILLVAKTVWLSGKQLSRDCRRELL